MVAKSVSRAIRKRELVLVGGGHSHVQVLRRYAMEPPENTRITLIVDIPLAVYSGMVPGFVAGQYRAEELEIDVVPLARRARARVILSPALGIDPEAKHVLVEGRPPVPYDVVSFDIGSTVAGLDLPGVREHAVATRPIGRFVGRVQKVVDQAKRREGDEPFRIVIVGGGAGGVELAFTLEHRLRTEGVANVHALLVNAGARILQGYSDHLVHRVYREAEMRAVEFVHDRRVASVEAGKVILDDGEALPADVLVWVTGAASHPIFSSSEIATDDRGFLLVRPTLQARDHDDVFAAGDCAALIEHPETPKAGVYAVREGPYLIDNLRAALAGTKLREYRPQSDFLTLLNLGDGEALGAKWGFAIGGRWVMGWKDWIDRRFMRRFQVLESDGTMTEDFQAQKMEEMDVLCGGCAAKVGQSVLERALARLEPPEADDDVILGLTVPDDAAAHLTPSGDIAVSSLDAFKAFTDDPYLVGRVGAVNAASDVLAKGIAPRRALALVSIPEDASDTAAEEMLVQVMAGARAAFDELGVTLLGGHTTTAAELVVGFHVEGYAETPDELRSIDRLEPDQALVVSKALGTGVLFHADMKGLARGPWIESALAAMQRSNARAAGIAVAAGATAMTDVTGFGILGHLAEMLRASGCSATIDVTSLPALDGAVELLSRGERSTFHEENAKARRGIRASRGAAADPRFELLFDPQTSGGLLFGVPPKNAWSVVAALKTAGERAAVVGRVTERRKDGALVKVTKERRG